MKLVKCVARAGGKPASHLPLQRMCMEATLEVHKELEKGLGPRLKGFVVVSGILTDNVSGVPIKVVEKDSEKRN